MAGTHHAKMKLQEEFSKQRRLGALKWTENTMWKYSFGNIRNNL